MALANWAESDRNDLDGLEAAAAAAIGIQLPDGGPLREPGGLEGLLAHAGLPVVAAGLVEVPWQAPDGDILVDAVMLGSDRAGVATTRPAIVAAAASLRTAGGDHRLVNGFRYAVSQVSISSGVST